MLHLHSETYHHRFLADTDWSHVAVSAECCLDVHSDRKHSDALHLLKFHYDATLDAE